MLFLFDHFLVFLRLFNLDLNLCWNLWHLLLLLLCLSHHLNTLSPRHCIHFFNFDNFRLFFIIVLFSLLHFRFKFLCSLPWPFSLLSLILIIIFSIVNDCFLDLSFRWHSQLYKSECIVFNYTNIKQVNWCRF